MKLDRISGCKSPVRAARILAQLGCGLCLAVVSTGAHAQFNRSRPPQQSSPPPASPPAARPSPPANSSPPAYVPPVNRTRTPSAGTPGNSGVGSGRTNSSTNDRGGSALDRYHRMRESSDAQNPIGRTPHAHYYLYPYGYYPGGYYPGGYGWDPYGYPEPYPYPGPQVPTYPVPGGGGIVGIARYDSPYYYCGDLIDGQYVGASAIVISKPKKLYTPMPRYRDGELEGWRDLDADDYLRDRNADNNQYRIREKEADDPALEAAVNDIKQSWTTGDVEPLAAHLRKDTLVAVILRDKYLYSLEAGDFLEVTRNAYASASHLRFTLDHLHRKSDGIYALTGRHFYTDTQGKERVVYMSYVLVKEKDGYILTQIASAPEKE